MEACDVTDPMSESSRNWADLPGEIANLIFKKLPADRIYVQSFRAVCKNWRSAVPRSEPQLQLPWLIEHKRMGENNLLSLNLCFYSLAGGDTGRITIPEHYCGMVYYGPGHGYLLISSLHDDLNLLMNPLTGDLILLPKLNNGDGVDSPACSGLDEDPLDNWHMACYVRVDYLLKKATAIYHADQNEWTYVMVDSYYAFLYSTCCWDGKLFLTWDVHSTEVFDAFSGEKLYEVLPPENELNERDLYIRTFLVESCGEILRVSLFTTNSETLEVVRFDIYKLYSEEGQHSLIKVNDIGNQIVFLDRRNGFSMRPPVGFKGNCIYFMSEYHNTPSTPSRYDIDTKIVERVPCPFRNCTWFIPNLG